MNEEELKAIASQLRQPHGEFGAEMGRKMNEGNQFINRHTIQTMQLQENDHVLEIGMGNGNFVGEVLERGEQIRYTGCDFSSLMVEEANKLNHSWVASGRVSFHHGVAHELPFDDHSFDKIFTVNTIYFWEDPEAVLKEFRRVLKKSGCLTIGLRPKEEMAALPMTRYGFNMYSQDEMVRLLRNHDWTVKMMLEIAEPEQEFFNQKYKVSSLICGATPNHS